ncbi:MAG: Na/Pi cotransporter family protein [Kiritimatiellae bacterium]|nr:Na/Pi cotransporter family protein [Kiritimatiellia bacterium]
MNLVLDILLPVFGGLGVFLLGMKHLSEGLQAISGSRLRKFMALATTHKVAGISTGVFSTMIVQSSSVITVMVIGFISSGLMNLPQAINVILGANIGTTVTAWIVAFAPSPKIVGLGGLAIGGLLYFFVRREKIHNTGLAILGLGLVFLGLFFMSTGAIPIRQNPQIAAMFQSMSADSYWGIIKIAFLGLIVTAVIQSSSATVAIVMTLAQQGLVSAEVAITVMFGSNIGTTMTAWLASFGTSSRDAKRAAFAHTLSNVIGSLVFIPLLPVIFYLVRLWQPDLNQVTVFLNGGGKEVFDTVAEATAKYKDMPLACLNVMVPIALVDSLFATFRCIITICIEKPFVKFIRKVIPESASEEKPRLSFLNYHAINSPYIACDQAEQEMYFMAESNIDLLNTIRKVLDGNATEQDEEHIFKRETILDNVQQEVTEFLRRMMSSRLSSEVASRARDILRLTDELESASDEAPAIMRVIRRLRLENQKISEVSNEALKKAHDAIFAFVSKVTESMKKPKGYYPVETAQADSRELHNFIRELRQRQLGRIGPDDPSSSLRVLVELDILNAYGRIRSYYINIAETLAGGKKTST